LLYAIVSKQLMANSEPSNPPKKRKGAFRRLFKLNKEPDEDASTSASQSQEPISNLSSASLVATDDRTAVAEVPVVSVPPPLSTHQDGNDQTAASGAEADPEPRSVPNLQPETDVSGASETKALPPISDLWDAAYDELAKGESTSQLIADLQDILTKDLKVHKVATTRVLRRDQMQTFVKKRTEEIESGTWKLKFKGHEFAVKDLVIPVVSIVEWGKENIGSAVEASPPASIAWAGVCLLLPVCRTTSNAPQLPA
jgi:N-terminal domain of NWD NACHT-NTPase